VSGRDESDCSGLTEVYMGMRVEVEWKQSRIAAESSGVDADGDSRERSVRGVHLHEICRHWELRPTT
jgi:hypothetical protein